MGVQLPGEHPHALPSAEQAGAANMTQEDKEDILLKYCGW
jgi:hypothetical protein